MTTPYRPLFLLDRRIEPGELTQLIQSYFQDLVKVVVDVRRRIACAGGKLHWDAGDFLVKNGSREEDLWGVNYYPGLPRSKCINFISQLNDRPEDPGATVRDEALRRQLRDIVFELVGCGRPVWWELDRGGRVDGMS